MELIKQSELKPASFQNRTDRTLLQTELILELLTKGIKENKVIDRDDIINCYVKYVFREGRVVTIQKMQDWKWVDLIVDEEDFKKEYWTKSKALNWFKCNLGAAILKGRILAIPVIDI
jgi:hypothetical protein